MLWETSLFFKGDEINPSDESDEQEMNEKGETEIRWKGLTDKNSDKLYAPKQLLPQSDYEAEHKEIFERCVSKYRKLLDGAREGIMEK